MSFVPKCTPDQIAQKKREALERLQRYKEQKKQMQKRNSENRLKLPADQVDTVQSKPQLSDEQKAAIERKRVAAIELAKSNNLISQAKAEDLITKNSSPGKSPAPSKVAMIQSRINPYKHPRDTTLKPIAPQVMLRGDQYPGKALTPSKAALTSNRTSPYQKPPEKIVKHINCLLEVVSNDRFVANIDGYSEVVIEEFKKLSSKSYNQQTKSWTFDLSEHKILVEKLKAIERFVKVEPIPDFVISNLLKPEPTEDESCLEVIEPELLNSLMKFQREAVCFGISRNGRFLLADDMGLGKTRQALAIADYYRKDWPLLIVTTASTRIWWQQQIMDLLPKVNVLDIHVLESTKESIMSSKVLICSYTSLENNMKRLMLKDFGMIILDESHNIKNQKSKQTINATKLCEKAKHVLLMSGTPALSRPAELFPQLYILDPKFTSFFTFTKRYCDGKTTSFGYTFTGSTNLDELNILLRKKFMVRRTKEEVYSELGGKNRQLVELKDIQMEKRDLDYMQNFSSKYHSAEGKLQKQKEILLQWYSETSKLKADAVCRYLENYLTTTNEKCLIFAHHRHVVTALTDSLLKNKIRFMCIEGSTKAINRNVNVESFQNDPEMRCAVLSIRACSAGITLTAASTVIFAELDWTPSNIIQAEARAHRIGQERQVTCIYLIAKGTADDIMWKMLQEKQKNLTKAGLVTTGEHLSVNITTTTFNAGPSTSVNNSLITDFFNKSLNSSDTFYTCGDSDDILNNIDLQAIEAEAKEKERPKVADILDGIDFDFEDDFAV